MEKPIELGDSWFYAKPIKVGRALSSSKNIFCQVKYFKDLPYVYRKCAVGGSLRINPATAVEGGGNALLHFSDLINWQNLKSAQTDFR